MEEPVSFPKSSSHLSTSKIGNLSVVESLVIIIDIPPFFKYSDYLKAQNKPIRCREDRTGKFAKKIAVRYKATYGSYQDDIACFGRQNLRCSQEKYKQGKVGETS